MLTVEDRLAIRELIDLYGYVIDTRTFEEARRIFTPDARYDISHFGMGVIEGVDNIIALWRDPAARHPVAHHATNILLTPETPDRVLVRSKGLGVMPDGRVGSVDYVDIAIRSGEGWRISERTATLRRAPREA